MATTAKRVTSPRDATGRVKRTLETNRDLAEKEAAKAQLAEAQVADEVRSQVVDLTAPPAANVEQLPVVVGESTREMRVVEDLENVTIGYRNTFTFEAGRTYKVPAFVYNHLAEKGYVWGA
ncbi:hypothetical protein ADL22_12425 [Streptomyces sp. NRRL F-4489]|uniref:hypothetical protein n=1 Tax=Streptomyces sp. NRRL F-4489 TaxID=1609095 RepID=UPI0007483431|nr:hypothetical protein [Streptomyces sp. NRRL F-4489]KUL44743.1 hypothetical protein ADL22_12425 [Streptomyces sp. NRRL F-4489]